ncbi:MAG: glycosyltransferase family 2 protein [Candidatus Hodarchaeales archaeon]|jgi:glycosyltransferase involved in cell wall biosynthesis
MYVDVVILTKNSEYILEKCLSSVYKNIPIHNLIVVDGYSKDNTINIIHDFNKKYGNIKIVSSNGTRGTAREIGVNNVETEWFMFVDSDIILCADWFKKASKYVDNDVGAVWGINIDLIENFNNQTFYKLFMNVSKAAFKIRGGMHDTLIRYDAVKDIKIPPHLHTYEDAYIVKWIKEQGYKVLIGDDLYCFHLRPPEDWDIKESISLASWEMKSGLFHLKAFKYILYYPFFSFYWLLQKYKRVMNNRLQTQVKIS